MANRKQNAGSNASGLLSVPKLAEYLGVSRKFVYEHSAPSYRQNPIPSLKLGKFRVFRLEEVEAWLADQGR